MGTWREIGIGKKKFCPMEKMGIRLKRRAEESVCVEIVTAVTSSPGRERERERGVFFEGED